MPRITAVAVVLLLLFAISGPTPAGGFVLQIIGGCTTSDDVKNMSFFNKLVFNKQILAYYNAKDHLFLPCPGGCIPQVMDAYVNITTYLNKDGNTSRRIEAQNKKCSMNAQLFWNETAERTRPPTVHIIPIEPVNPGDPAMLACYVFGFYPQDISITWLRNDDLVPILESGSALRPNGDWTYQARVYVERTADPGDEYTCRVQHSSQGEPIYKKWKSGLTQLQQIKIGISVAVLILGLIFLVAGLIICQRFRSSGYVPIPGYSYREVS